MHASSLWNMRVCLATYGLPRILDAGRARVLDVGSNDVNGSYRQLFEGCDVEYVGVDMAEGRGVDVVLSDPYQLPFEAGSLDFVLCGQMLEHCEFPWLSVREMMRVLRPSGLLFLIAPSGGPIHRFPVDCYRFYPDAYRAFAKDAGCHLIDVWLDDKGPWNDLVGVFGYHPQSPQAHECELPWDVPSSAWRPPSEPADPREEVISGDIKYIDALAELHQVLAPRLYLELGVRNGHSLALAKGRAIGVDPYPDITQPLASTTSIVRSTSDAFFQKGVALLDGGVDLALIDGMHWAEYVFRDFVGVEKHSNPWAVVVIDDAFPSHPAQARRRRHTQVWTGDVWRAVECVKAQRPELIIVPLSTRPTGMALIAGLDPESRVLRDNYNPLLAGLLRDQDDPVPDHVLGRQGARRIDDPSVLRLLAVLGNLGAERASSAIVRRDLRRLRREIGL